MEIKASDFIRPENNFWFQWDATRPTTFQAISFGDKSRLQVGRDNGTEFESGYIVPVSMFRDSPEARAISPQYPLKSLTEVLASVFNSYGSVDKSEEFKRNWETLSPIFALRENQGVCYDITSIGLAIARAAGIEARAIGHSGLLERRAHRINQLLGIKIFPGIGHYWLEVKQDDRWAILETVSGLMRRFNANISERYICAEVPVCEMVDKAFLKKIDGKEYTYQSSEKIC
jgi:hypothetical protein